MVFYFWVLRTGGPELEVLHSQHASVVTQASGGHQRDTVGPYLSTEYVLATATCTRQLENTGEPVLQTNLALQKTSSISKFLRNLASIPQGTVHFPPSQTYAIKRFLAVRTSGRMAGHQAVNGGDGGSIPPATISKLRQFRSPHICLCLSEETLKAGGSFYLPSMPGVNV